MECASFFYHLATAPIWADTTGLGWMAGGQADRHRHRGLFIHCWNIEPAGQERDEQNSLVRKHRFLRESLIPRRICVAAAGSSPFMTVTSGEDSLHTFFFVVVVVCIRMKNTTCACSLRSKSLMARLVPTCSVSGCLGITVVLGGDSQVVAPCEKCLGTLPQPPPPPRLTFSFCPTPLRIPDGDNETH